MGGLAQCMAGERPGSLPPPDNVAIDHDPPQRWCAAVGRPPRHQRAGSTSAPSASTTVLSNTSAASRSLPASRSRALPAGPVRWPSRSSPCPSSSPPVVGAVMELDAGGDESVGQGPTSSRPGCVTFLRRRSRKRACRRAAGRADLPPGDRRDLAGSRPPQPGLSKFTRFPRSADKPSADGARPRRARQEARRRGAASDDSQSSTGAPVDGPAACAWDAQRARVRDAACALLPRARSDRIPLYRPAFGWRASTRRRSGNAGRFRRSAQRARPRRPRAELRGARAP
ncbi:uncharacterized protein SOCE26_049890 [Sorangium cellulosum]|uniref:Uncharacterized protein n=1 Tax=Sorangium cellulosum TaxID=56 RepID=A0A2L0EW97_SORCE|nr:uncharacterized protein SOCE26_049890 [Sorangium cellulosum]